MKKCVVLLLTMVSLASCATLFSGNSPKYTFDETDPYNDGLVTVSVPSLRMQNRMTAGNEVIGVNVSILNKSTKSVTVLWSDSSIDYKGKSHLVFLSNRYLADAGKAMPDSHLSAGQEVTWGIIPADNAPAANAQYADAVFNGISSKDISCRISIDLGGELRVYVVHVQIAEPEAQK